ncbi:MAG TPA: LLM class flavin-dependent oxidoreductase [Acidimicrobiia bacterium]|jgi:alkanesulfonate monooxygenase SsuD/methylene tetrahydromethanopterin reductase-like flavin-dependent oxidoreductase (luciferase family)|nr:LLM class flavin-dependent oxidoreductase [Acidimicrobiia bacterium]
MEFGLFQGGFVHKDLAAKNPNAEHDRLMSEVNLCEVGDKHNWKYAWFTEHHFLQEYSHISASETLMAWVLARTQNIHVASGIINITPPVNHPARVAERVAMMDLVSNGRFEFGTGRGSSTTEMGGFGITDPEITREMYDESIREIVRMWRDEPYAYDGKFFSMPERHVLPKPYVKPHPPLWVAAGNPETFERAAKMGIGVICFTGGTPEKMAPLVETYKKHIKDAEPVGEYINDNIAITTSFMCLEDRDEARNYMANSGNGRQQTLVFHYLDTFPKPPFVPEWPTEIPDPTLSAIEKGFQSGAAIVGTPDDCAEGIQKWVDIGVDQLIMGPSGSTYSDELLERTVTLFGDEVIPRFDKDPEHSTSKYRAAAASRK